MVCRIKKICLFTITLMLVTPFSMAKDYFGSIAINEETGAYAFDADSSQDYTDKEAIRKCEKVAKNLNKGNKWGYSDKERACEVVVQLERKQCGALATGSGAFGWAITQGKYITDRTRRDALRYCRKNGGRRCEVAAEVCTK